MVHAYRMARRVVRDRFAVTKLFDEIGPRFLSRRGGYTRIVKIGQRPGDAAPMSLLELIPDEAPKRAEGPGDKGGGEKKGKGGEGGGGAAPAAKAKGGGKGKGEAAAAGSAPAAKKKGGGAEAKTAAPAKKSGKAGKKSDE